MKNIKKSTTKKNRKQLPLKRIALVMIGIIAVVTIILQVLINKHLLDRTIALENKQITDNVAESFRDFGKEPQADVRSNDIYIPESKLRLPPYPAELLFGIRYALVNPTDSNKELFVSSTGTMRSNISSLHRAQSLSLEDFSDSVSRVQNCSRQVSIALNADMSTNTFPLDDKVSTKILADGRTLTIYKNRMCTQDAETLIKYLNQAQSY